MIATLLIINMALNLIQRIVNFAAYYKNAS